MRFVLPRITRSARVCFVWFAVGSHRYLTGWCQIGSSRARTMIRRTGTFTGSVRPDPGGSSGVWVVGSPLRSRCMCYRAVPAWLEVIATEFVPSGSQEARHQGCENWDMVEFGCALP
jgi:hypothetical protein